jgi:lipoyl(octanoyl) transferase
MPTSSPTSPRAEPSGREGAHPLASPPLGTWRWLGRVGFAETVELQERLRRDVIAGHAPETLLFCEHDPVITLGRSARAANVLASADELARRGVAVHDASRGGDVTYHGPGQLVGYPIVRLRGGLVAHLEAMARGLAALLAELGITAAWRREVPGLWTNDGERSRPAKICAFGVHVRHRVTIHGFALNVTTALDAFDLIVPCGLRDAEVTSIAALARDAPTVEALAPRAAAAIADALGLRLGNGVH